VTEPISNKSKPRALITLREFGRRLGNRSYKTIERMIERGVPGMPLVVWVNRQRFFDEQAVDAFIAATVARGVLAGEEPPKPIGAAAMRVEEAKARRSAQSARKERKSRR
jgi:hypothetical protein